MAKGKIFPYDDSEVTHTRSQANQHHTPEGVPISLMIKVERDAKGKTGTDIEVKGNKLEIRRSNASPATADFVFGEDTDYRDIFERSVMPLTKALCDGVPTTLFVLGSNGCSKSNLTEKLLPLAAQSIVDQISKMKNQNGSKYSYGIQLRAYEIYDEVVQDLLSSNNRDLRIKYDMAEGHSVKHCSVQGPFVGVDEVLEAIVDAFAARTTAICDFGPASRYTHTIWELTLTQLTQNKNGTSKSSLKSKFTLVELAATNMLLEDRASVRTREGPTLSKSLFMLDSIASSFSDGEQLYAPFSESKLTRLLYDSLVGNSISLSLALVVYGEPDASLATLSLAQKLRKGITYPLVNDDRVQGLVRLYRSQIIQLRDELQSTGKPVVQENSDSDDLKVKVKDLEGRIVKDNLEKLKIKEEKERIYGKLVEFRTKYNQLVEQKSQIQASSIKSEEEKLKIARALLDLRIENNSLVEQCESEKYELVTKVLALENEILQYEMKEEKRDKSSTMLAEQTEAAKSSCEEYKHDLMILKEAFLKLESQFKDEVGRNEELGTELLTLVNQKRIMEDEFSDLKKGNSELIERNSLINTKYQELVDGKQHLEERLQEVHAKAETHQSDRMKLELDLKRLIVDHESKILELTRATEEQSGISKISFEKEMQRNKTQKESIERELKELKPLLKQCQRKVGELETSMVECTSELQTIKTENATMTESMSNMTDSYRNRLTELLDHDDLPALQTELLKTFKDKEVELERKIKRLNQTNSKVVEKNRTLATKFTNCRQKLQDLDVDIGDDTWEDALRVATSHIEDEMSTEIAVLNERVAKQGYELQNALEKNIQLTETTRITNRDSIAKISSLEDQIKQLEKQNTMMEAHGGKNTVDGVTNSRMEEIQNVLLAKIEELRNKTTTSTSNQSNSDQELRQQLDECKTKLNKAELKLKDSERRRTKEKLFPTSARDNAEIQQLRSEIARLKKMNEVRPPVQGDGKDIGDLLTRCTVAEEELLQYKTYMQKSLLNSQEQIKKIKAERDEWKRKASN